MAPKRILLVTNSEHGQANVFLAVAYALLTLPDQNVEVHFASFPSIQPSVQSTSELAQRHNPRARPIVFHTISGPAMVTAWSRPSLAAERASLASVNTVLLIYAIRRMAYLLKVLLPWTGAEFYEIFTSVISIHDDLVKPSLTAVDPAFSPALTALRHLQAPFLILSPNTIKDFSLPAQPGAEALWKYPCIGSPDPFPVPGLHVPANILLVFVALFCARFFDTHRREIERFFEEHFRPEDVGLATTATASASVHACATPDSDSDSDSDPDPDLANARAFIAYKGQVGKGQIGNGQVRGVNGWRANGQRLNGQGANGQGANGQGANGQGANGQRVNGHKLNGQTLNGKPATEEQTQTQTPPQTPTQTATTQRGHRPRKTKIKVTTLNDLSLNFSPTKILVANLPQIEFPLAILPENIIPCGPILQAWLPLSETDPSLARWITQAPTVYVNLGTHVVVDEEFAVEMARGLRTMLDAVENILWRDERLRGLQVLWKLNLKGKSNPTKPKPEREQEPGSGRGPESGPGQEQQEEEKEEEEEEEEEETKSEVYSILSPELSSSRIKLVPWFAAPPTSILEHPNIILSVHHGGANSFLEAVSFGIPQVVLPVWMDTYDFARRAEILNIGRWGNQLACAGGLLCTGKELGSALIDVLIGGKSSVYTSRAKELADLCKKSGGGRVIAARRILDEMEAVNNMKKHNKEYTEGDGNWK